MGSLHAKWPRWKKKLYFREKWNSCRSVAKVFDKEILLRIGSAYWSTLNITIPQTTNLVLPQSVTKKFDILVILRVIKFTSSIFAIFSKKFEHFCSDSNLFLINRRKNLPSYASNRARSFALEHDGKKKKKTCSSLFVSPKVLVKINFM